MFDDPHAHPFNPADAKRELLARSSRGWRRADARAGRPEHGARAHAPKSGLRCASGAGACKIPAGEAPTDHMRLGGLVAPFEPLTGRLRPAIRENMEAGHRPVPPPPGHRHRHRGISALLTGERPAASGERARGAGARRLGRSRHRRGGKRSDHRRRERQPRPFVEPEANWRAAGRDSCRTHQRRSRASLLRSPSARRVA